MTLYKKKKKINQAGILMREKNQWYTPLST